MLKLNVEVISSSWGQTSLYIRSKSKIAVRLSFRGGETTVIVSSSFSVSGNSALSQAVNTKSRLGIFCKKKKKLKKSMLQR